MDAAPNNSIVMCSICGKPCQLEDCKVDADGKAVHELCIVAGMLDKQDPQLRGTTLFLE